MIAPETGSASGPAARKPGPGSIRISGAGTAVPHSSQRPSRSRSPLYVPVLCLLAFSAHATGLCFAAFFAEASAYAEGPRWLMRGNLVGDRALRVPVGAPAERALRAREEAPENEPFLPVAIDW